MLELDIDADEMMRLWARIIIESAKERDPANDAFERVRMLFIQSEYYNDAPNSAVQPSWHYLRYDRRIIAARRDGQSFWRVMHTSREWNEIVGSNSIELHAHQWQERGWLIPHKDGALSKTSWIGTGAPRCVLIPSDIISPPQMSESDETI
jgi:hypothetical protein